MTKRTFVYIGGRPELQVLGVTFVAGQPQEVDSEKHPLLAFKLPGHSDFLAIPAQPADNAGQGGATPAPAPMPQAPPVIPTLGGPPSGNNIQLQPQPAPSSGKDSQSVRNPGRR